MFVSIHIPKTAGTSLSIIFDYGSGRRILYDYKQLRKLITDLPYSEEAYSNDIASIKKHSDFIRDNFDFIHGHFRYKKYISIFPEAHYITCVRKPINRLISHYHHVLDEKVEDYWLYQEIVSGNIDLVDMAKIPGIGNLQSDYLNGRDIREFEHVFLNEKLADSVYQFQLIYSFNRNDPYMNLEAEKSIPKLNKSQDRACERRKFSKNEIEKAEYILEEDNELYLQAIEKFVKQAKLAAKYI